MRRPFFYKCGAMTLTELLVASALVGVVLAGALSADQAIRTWQKRIENRALSGMGLATVMERLKGDGMAAVGAGVEIGTVPSQKGIYYDILERYIAFRHDPDAGVPGDEFYVSYDYQNLHLRRNGVNILRVTDPDFLQVHSAGTGDGIEAIEITLRTRSDPDAPADAVTNPEYTLNARFFPPGISQ